MAKIVRYNGNLVPFASSSLGTERTIFGQVTQANDITSQFTPEFLRGWGIVGPSDQPTLQDFNAVSYTHGQILAYLHQVGVPEYNAAQEYHIGSFCNLSGVLYVSTANNNTGNTPSAGSSFWSSPLTGALIAVRVFTVSGTYTPTPGTKSIVVRLVGGGGGSGGANPAGAGQISAGGNGGGGAYAEGRFTSGFSGLAITIGPGGALGGVGGAGGATSLGSLISASGGSGGGAGTAFTPPGSSGGASAGGISITGGNIESSTGFVAQAITAISTTTILNVAGAQSKFGPGPTGGFGNGTAGVNKGAGASGALAGPSTGPFNGAIGAPGYMVIEEYL